MRITAGRIRIVVVTTVNRGLVPASSVASTHCPCFAPSIPTGCTQESYVDFRRARGSAVVDGDLDHTPSQACPVTMEFLVGTGPKRSRPFRGSRCLTRPLRTCRHAM